MKARTIVIFGLLSVFGVGFILSSSDGELIANTNSNSVDTEILNSSEILFHYESNFSEKEKVKLEKWLKITTDAVNKRIGVYPFALHYYIHRSENASEPVPWANTERSEIQGVNFHVNPDYSLEMFLNDWTAPHEISHLAIPFMGKSNSWFAEGFATYMQNEVLLEMDEMSEQDVQKKYKSKLDLAYPYYQEEEPFAEVAMNLRKQHRYPQMYWGGAYFFVQLDESLKENSQMSLCEVLHNYQECCRLKDKSVDDLINSIDAISKGTNAKTLINDYRTLPAREIMEKQ